jgi:hypothetical protein
MAHAPPHTPRLAALARARVATRRAAGWPPARPLGVLSVGRPPSAAASWCWGVRSAWGAAGVGREGLFLSAPRPSRPDSTRLRRSTRLATPRVQGRRAGLALIFKLRHPCPPPNTDAGRGAACPAGDASSHSSGSASGAADAAAALNNKAAAGAAGAAGAAAAPPSDGANAADQGAGGGTHSDGVTAAFDRVTASLGPPDYSLDGAGWSVPAHRGVLRARCPHFRARLGSGMRDADGATSAVPEGFSRRSVEARGAARWGGGVGPRSGRGEGAKGAWIARCAGLFPGPTPASTL